MGLLNVARGHPMLVELKNGETLNGHLVNCDNFMNLVLKSVVQTSPEGDKFMQLPEVYVRGNNVSISTIARASATRAWARTRTTKTTRKTRHIGCNPIYCPAFQKLISVRMKPDMLIVPMNRSNISASQTKSSTSRASSNSRHRTRTGTGVATITTVSSEITEDQTGVDEVEEVVGVGEEGGVKYNCMEKVKGRGLRFEEDTPGCVRIHFGAYIYYFTNLTNPRHYIPYTHVNAL